MSAPSRLAPRACRLCRSSPTFRRAFASATTRITTTTTTTPSPTKTDPWPQCQPRGEYYDILLRDPTPYGAAATARTAEEVPTSSSAAPTLSEAAVPTTSGGRPAKTYETIASRTAYSGSSPSDAAERARVIFGSRLLGPAERADRAAGRLARATTVGGVRVPPRPEEPDNCCMSGCVNCVWDLFREEMEEWTLASNAAKARLAESAVAGGSGGPLPDDAASPSTVASAPAGVAVGDAKIAKDLWTDDVFQHVPVGIREFMKQEKRLKEKHQREGTSGG
ncbi:Oxidoreductase-like protein [Cordyceps fumosorosea ARSEF 2679]|uniref:Oxidoreductase-like protein n=1 Tax=Cordyceps fumosorosea (strain ARSEF 2679) TaxID=1081104 RepID=A0A168BXU8_CORFA|nr:Oxidoreductase-like protein [Cordyceps fumosorosea ARSEF 2679]OAA70686.1 Oxidoreductase-like protein [Cordyceps fumosorosea ARSEF 2679]